MSYTPVPTRPGRLSAVHTLPIQEEAEPLASGGSDDGEPEDKCEAGPSIIYLVSINSFAFAYSLVVATLGVVILPSEAIRLFSENHAMMLGVMLGFTGITQLIGPAVGYQSDRSTSKYGRRRPLMVVGAIIACLGSLVMLVAHEYRLRYTFIGALTASISGLNIRCVRAADASSSRRLRWQAAVAGGGGSARAHEISSGAPAAYYTSCALAPSLSPHQPLRPLLVAAPSCLPAATRATRLCCQISCRRPIWAERAARWRR